MSKFCKYCGEKLNDAEICTCHQAQKEQKQVKQTEQEQNSGLTGIVDAIKEKIGLQTVRSKMECFEKEKKIVPDCIVPDDGEIPIRQYHIASLRTILKGMYAEGRLQVTNKRVLFRAAGISLLGTTELQHEFAIEEIAGIEIRRDHRLGVFHILLAMILTSFFMNMTEDLFTKVLSVSGWFANLTAFLLTVFSIGLFFLVKKKFLVKLLVLAAAFGAIGAVGFNMRFFIIPVSNGAVYTFLGSVTGFLMIFCMVLLGFVPNLVVEIKTKSASSPVEIRRKESNGLLAFLFNMPKKDYTGFADVMPGRDVQKAVKELGAMINDLNVFGDEAIPKWKEE